MSTNPKFYPLADRDYPTIKREFDRLGSPISFGEWGAKSATLKAVFTGVCRPPKAGEWYLSGAEVEAYRAGVDMSTPYQIAEIVEVETITIQRIRRAS